VAVPGVEVQIVVPTEPDQWWSIRRHRTKAGAVITDEFGGRRHPELAAELRRWIGSEDGSVLLGG
jgi:hypothetical protein